MSPAERPIRTTRTAARLPRGPHRLGRDVVLASQRARMIESVVSAAAAKGYGQATVADVVGAAGVSRKTFYEHFNDKEECFLAAYDAIVAMLLDAVIAARPDGEGWLALMRARVHAYLAALAARPERASSFMLEVLAAGPRALRRRAEVHRRFEQLFRDLHEEARREYPRLAPVPDAHFAAAVGATNELVSRYVADGRSERLCDLEPALVQIQVSLLVGRETAANLG